MTNNLLLKKLYYDVDSPFSFSSADKLLRGAKEYDPSIKKRDVLKWLRKQLTYTLHKQKRNVFSRNKIQVNHINEQWEADLVDLKEFKSRNSGYSFILTVIDVFSKMAYVKALKTKSSKEVANKFGEICKIKVPLHLRTDRGKEFENSDFKKLMKSLKINHFFPKNNIKCSVIERFNRTLKNKMFKYFTFKNTRKYIDVLDKIVKAYNNTYHRSIKMSPSQVSSSNEKLVFKNLFGVVNERSFIRKNKVSVKYNIGDLVRIQYERKVFDKGYYPNWTDQIYRIFKINNSTKYPFFTLQTYDKTEILPRRYYAEEIQKIDEDLFRVEKVIKRKTENGITYYFVKWLNYPSSYNSWISQNDIDS